LGTSTEYSGENEGCENMEETWERSRELEIASAQPRLGHPHAQTYHDTPLKEYPLDYAPYQMYLPTPNMH